MRDFKKGEVIYAGGEFFSVCSSTDSLLLCMDYEGREHLLKMGNGVRKYFLQFEMEAEFVHGTYFVYDVEIVEPQLLHIWLLDGYDKYFISSDEAEKEFVRYID